MPLPFSAATPLGPGFLGLLLPLLWLCGNRADARIPKDGISGRTPVMGWNSWNAYRCDVNEGKILSAAIEMNQVGLHSVGYNYVIVDDCWSQYGEREPYDPGNRSSALRLKPDLQRFPHGMKGLGDRLHEMGYKFGIYSSAGEITCAGYPGSLYFEDIDAQTFASWGVDYLKYDNCGVPQTWGQDLYHNCHPDYPSPSTKIHGFNQTCIDDPNLAPPGYDWSQSSTAARFYRMRDALERQDRTILLSLCQWGQAGVTQWGPNTGISWRISDDIFPTWHHIKHITDIATFTLTSTGFFGHADADMLEVGNGNLSLAEQRTHFALWAAMKSPLLIGTNIAQLSPCELGILKNAVLINFNQDSVYGRPAFPFNFNWIHNDERPASHWAGRSQAGTLVLLVNWDDHRQDMSVIFDQVPELPKGPRFTRRRVFDAWTGQDYGCLRSWSGRLAIHDTAVLMVLDDCREVDFVNLYGHNSNNMRGANTRMVTRPWTQKVLDSDNRNGSATDVSGQNCTMTVQDTPFYHYLNETEMPVLFETTLEPVRNDTVLEVAPMDIHETAPPAPTNVVKAVPGKVDDYTVLGLGKDVFTDVKDVDPTNYLSLEPIESALSSSKSPKKSEPVPEPSSDDEILQRVVGDNYEKQVISNTKDILLFVYVPSQSNMTYEQLYDLAYELGCKNQASKIGREQVRMALVDLSANNIKLPEKVKKYPTVLLYPGDRKKMLPIQFPADKEMTAESLAEFLAEYGAYHRKIDLLSDCKCKR